MWRRLMPLALLLACTRVQPGAVPAPIAPGPPAKASAPAVGVVKSRLEKASPLDSAPTLIALPQPSTECGQPLQALIAGRGHRYLFWQAWARDSRIDTGFMLPDSPTATGLWHVASAAETIEPIRMYAGVPKAGEASCGGTATKLADRLTSQNSLNPLVKPFEYKGKDVAYGTLTLLNSPPAWSSHVTPIMGMYSYARAMPYAHALTLYSATDDMLLQPIMGWSPPFDGKHPELEPRAVTSDHDGRIVILDRGDRLTWVGHLGSTPPQTLMLTDVKGQPLAPEDHLEKFAWGSNGKVLATNRQGVYRIDRKSGKVEKVQAFPAAPVAELQPGGIGPCCDVVYLYDMVAARGVFLVNPAGLPQVQVLDDVDLHLRATWSPQLPDGTPILAIRQMQAAFSTGWLWFVAQTAEKPDYAARVLVYRYPLPMTAFGGMEL